MKKVFLLLLLFPVDVWAQKTELQRELLISANEDRALGQLKKLLRKHRGTELEPGLLARRADLYLRKSKTARFFEYQGSSLNENLIPRNITKRSSLLWIKKAINELDAIEIRFAKYHALDAVLFQNGFSRQQLGDFAGALRKYSKIKNRFPHSSFLPETYLAMGEIYYEKQNFAKALQNYQAALKFQDLRLHSMALYKSAWSYYNLQKTATGLKVLEKLLTWEKKNGILLSRETLNDMTIFFSETKSAKEAYAYFKAQAADQAAFYLLKLGRLYRHHGKNNSAETVFHDIIKKQEMNETVAKVFSELIDLYKISRSYKKALLRLDEFNRRCQKGDCEKTLSPLALKLAVDWHKTWKKSSFAEPYLVLGQSADQAYEVFLNRKTETPEKQKIRFQRGELLFAMKEFRKASQIYALVSEKTTDIKLLHDAPYAALVSLEKAVSNKWSNEDEKEFARLTKVYIKNNPKGKFRVDLLYKQARISLGQGQVEDALWGFKTLGYEIGKSEKIQLAQDSYLDLLIERKRYQEIKIASFDWSKSSGNEKRKAKLHGLFLKSKFSEIQSFAENLEKADAYLAYSKKHANSPFADKALWNSILLQRKLGRFFAAAQAAQEFSKSFPKSEYIRESLVLSAQVFEELGELDEAAKSLQLSAPLLDKAKGDEARKLSKTFAAMSQKKKSDKKELTSVQQKLNKAKALYSQKKWPEAFRQASAILNERIISQKDWAAARMIQAEILGHEYRQQSLKTKSPERIALVLSIKTEKLKKAVRALTRVAQKGEAQQAVIALQKTSELYQDYVSAVKNFEFPKGLENEDLQALQGELNQMTLPIEDKAVEILAKALDVAMKTGLFGGKQRLLREKLRKLNFQPPLPEKINVDFAPARGPYWEVEA